MGAYFLKKLEPMVEKYPFVGEVRGQGLFLAVELVKDKNTREPLSKTVTQKIFMDCVKRGLLTMSYTARFRIQPSMTVQERTIDESIDILTEVFDALKTAGTWKE